MYYYIIYSPSSIHILLLSQRPSSLWTMQLWLYAIKQKDNILKSVCINSLKVTINKAFYTLFWVKLKCYQQKIKEKDTKTFYEKNYLFKTHCP